MTTPPSWLPPGINDPTSANNQQIEGDVQQYIDDQTQMTNDYDAIQTALANLFKPGQSPDAVFAAMMAFFMQIFPDILSYQQDNMNMLADSQNISSDLRGFVNSVQNDFNKGGNAVASDMQDMVNNTQDLSVWSTFLSGGDSGPAPWSGAAPLDPTDAGQINQMMTGTEGEFNGQVQTGWSWNTNTSSWDPVYQTAAWGNNPPSGDLTMQQTMAYWFNGPDAPPAPGTPGGPPAGQTPAPPSPVNPAGQIKSIQGNLQQANSSVSTMATTTQTSEQFYTNEYNQLTGIDNSMQQNQASEVSSFVTNQKTS